MVIVCVATAALMSVAVASTARWIDWLWWAAAFLALLAVGLVWLVLAVVGLRARQWALPLAPVLIVVVLAVPATDNRALRLAVWLSQSQLREAAQACDPGSAGWVGLVHIESADRSAYPRGQCELLLHHQFLNTESVVYSPEGRPRDFHSTVSEHTTRTTTYRPLSGGLYLRIDEW